MKKKYPLVSILVPIYNTADYIERCARSIFEQTYHNIEVIFFDDKTPDNSIEILETLIHKYEEQGLRLPEVKIHRAISNLGLPEVRNRSMDMAIGEYLFFLDSDDYLPENAIELLVEKTLSSDYDIVRGDFAQTSVGKIYRVWQNKIPDDKDVYINMMLNWCETVLSVWGGIYRKSLFTDNNLEFLSGHNMGEDFCMSSRLLFCANKIGYVPHVVYYYESNPNSITHSFSEKNAQDLIVNSNYVYSFYLTRDKDKIYYRSLIIGRAKIKNYILCYLTKEKTNTFENIFPEIKESHQLSLWGMIKCWTVRRSPFLFKVLNKINSSY